MELQAKKPSSQSEEEEYRAEVQALYQILRSTGSLSFLYLHGMALEGMFGRGWGRSACDVHVTVSGGCPPSYTVNSRCRDTFGAHDMFVYNVYNVCYVYSRYTHVCKGPCGQMGL